MSCFVALCLLPYFIALTPYSQLSALSQTVGGVTIHRDGDWYVAMDPVTGVASQGRSVDEALRNFQEAFELWFENAEPWERERAIRGEPIAAMVIALKV